MPEHSETRRIHDRLRQYWQSLKEQRPYPREDEIDPALVAEVWDYCFLADMRRGSVRHGFRYEYMGSALIDAYGCSMTAIDLCDAGTEPHIHSLMSRFDEVAESGEPATDEGEFTNTRGEQIRYRCCLLPLGAGKVESILGCMRWKVS
jgi:hypothetical protein